MRTKRAIKIEVELLNLRAAEFEQDGQTFEAALLRRRVQYLTADYIANQLKA